MYLGYLIISELSQYRIVIAYSKNVIFFVWFKMMFLVQCSILGFKVLGLKQSVRMCDGDGSLVSIL